MNISKLHEILKRMEKLRIILKDLTEERGNLDPEVISLSQQLDEVINEYYRILKIKR